MNKSTDLHKYEAWLERQAAPPDALSAALDTAFSPAPGATATRQALQAVHARLASQLTPIYYDRLAATPLGPLWLAVGAQGLVAIEYDGSEADFRDYLSRLNNGQPQHTPAKLTAAKRAVSAYLSGDSQHLGLDVDLSHLTDFQRRVLQETRRVPRGQVASYAEIAKRIGQPNAVRAVGQALRRNPVPIVVPCHRVIASDGSLGGYAGELRSHRKQQLLRLEGVALA